MNIKDCYNFNDFKKLAKKRLPSPIFHYIDGGADDEATLKRNTDAFNDCDLIPNVLASVGKPDLSTTVFGKKIDMPLFLSPTAMQRLYHHDGDKASARAAEKFGTFTVCPPWQTIPLRKLLKFLKVQNYFNFMFIKINQLLTI
jgi:L-lactate dehydrogenase (cytochrome)